MKSAMKRLAEAAKDLKVAALIVAEEPSRSVFHSQQAAEKSAKGFLVLHNVPFRKTHDLGELGGQCAALHPGLADLLAEADSLTDYALVFRYPDAPYELDEPEAVEALAVATRVCETIKRLVQT
jgi:HEPN domain-containing protein